MVIQREETLFSTRDDDLVGVAGLVEQFVVPKPEIGLFQLVIGHTVLFGEIHQTGYRPAYSDNLLRRIARIFLEIIHICRLPEYFLFFRRLLGVNVLLPAILSGLLGRIAADNPVRQ